MAAGALSSCLKSFRISTLSRFQKDFVFFPHSLAGWLRKIGERLWVSFWFVPIATITLFAALAFLMVQVDKWADVRFQRGRFWFIFENSTNASRDALNTISKGFLSISGVTFSILLVAFTMVNISDGQLVGLLPLSPSPLSDAGPITNRLVSQPQAANRYTPRLIATFAEDKMTQATLGTFLGIFLYGLIVQRSIVSYDEGERFLPHLSILFAFGLTMGGLFLYVLFIHHVAVHLHINGIAARLAAQITASMIHLFPTHLGQPIETSEEEQADEGWIKELTKSESGVDNPGASWLPVRAENSGYITSIDDAALLKWTDVADILYRMEHAVGTFVVTGEPLGYYRLHNRWSSSSLPRAHRDESSVHSLTPRYVLRAYTISHARNVRQDPEFGLQQLVDIALQALSSSLHDISTVRVCIDWLYNTVRIAADRKAPPRVRCCKAEKYNGESGADKARIIAVGPTFESMLHTAFVDLRQHSVAQVAVLRFQFEAFQKLASDVRNIRRLQILEDFVRLYEPLTEAGIDAAHDREQIKQAYRHLLEAIDRHRVHLLQEEPRDETFTHVTLPME
ncbi:hypothetical protein HDU89_008675 [Geranomyces variabilis]|nr:hypothetical protein HDU89_008675 [Geranomyces variabilis]